MKKLISYLVAAMMVFTMIPYTAFAESEKNEEMKISHTWVNPIYEDLISEEDLQLDSEPISTFSTEEVTYATTPEEAAAVVREYMVNRVESYTLYYKIPAADVEQGGNDWFTNLCDQIFPKAIEHTGNPCEGDFIRYTYGGYNIPSTNISGDGTYYYLPIPVTMTYYTTYDQEEELTAAVDELLAEIITNDMSDYEKVKAIYDYMTNNIVYDYDHYGDSTYLLQFSAYAALVNKTSVCQGYANLFYRLALECGIDCRIISGEATNSQGATEGHAWNIVKLGEKYYLVDATWDASRAQADTEYDYFLQATYSDHTSAAEYQTAEFAAAYPMAESAYVPCTTHTEETVPAVAATCTAAGLTAGSKCASCGKVITAQEVVPALGHTTVTDAAVEATCTATGLTEGSHCSTCEEVLVEQQEVAALGHSYGDWIVDTAADCENAGSQHKKCENCSDVVTETIPALDHDLVSHAAQAATCTEAGWEDYETCNRCGYTTYEEIAATGHTTVADAAVAATCTTKGKTAGSHCSVCGTVFTAQTEIAAKGHSYGEWIQGKAPTCTETGYMLRTCEACGAEESAELSMTEHSYGTEWTTDETSHWYECECGDKNSETEHTFAWICDKVATETENGLKHEECTVCGFVRNENTEIDKLTHTHTMTETAAVEATCTAAGNIVYYTCSGCGNLYADEEGQLQISEAETVVAATGHSYSETWMTNDDYHWYQCGCGSISERAAHEFQWIVDTPATEETAGSRHQECTVCGFEGETVEIEKLDHTHDMVKTEATAATCTKDGNIEYYTCNTCGNIYSDADGQIQITASEIIEPAAGHAEVTDAAVAATCTEAGLTEGSHCSVCEEVLVAQEKVAALGHDKVSHEAKAATCTTGGWKAYETCSRCDYTTYAAVAATGHAWESEFTVDKAATMKAAGSKSKHCANCDATTEVTTISRVKTATVKALIYNGSVRRPNPVIKDTNGKVLKKGTDYTVVYKNKAGTKVVKPKLVGKYTAVITFEGDYSGVKNVKFNINPKGAGVLKLSKKGKKQFTAKWTKRTVQVTGYQIRYSTKQNMNNSKVVTIKNFKTNTRTIKGLKAKKKYYVQVRTYKTVNGVKYYSAWSAKKSIKTK